MNKNCSTDIWSYQIGLTYDDICNFPSNYHFKNISWLPPPPPHPRSLTWRKYISRWFLMQIMSFNYLYLQSNWKVSAELFSSGIQLHCHTFHTASNWLIMTVYLVICQSFKIHYRMCLNLICLYVANNMYTICLYDKSGFSLKTASVIIKQKYHRQ